MLPRLSHSSGKVSVLSGFVPHLLWNASSLFSAMPTLPQTHLGLYMATQLQDTRSERLNH